MAGERATVHKLNDAPKAKGKCCISMAYLEGGVRVVFHLIGSSKYVYDEGYSRVAARFVRGQRVTNRRYQPLGERCPIIGRVSKTTTVAPSPPHGTNHVLARLCGSCPCTPVVPFDFRNRADSDPQSRTEMAAGRVGFPSRVLCAKFRGPYAREPPSRLSFLRIIIVSYHPY